MGERLSLAFMNAPIKNCLGAPDHLAWTWNGQVQIPLAHPLCQQNDLPCVLLHMSNHLIDCIQNKYFSTLLWVCTVHESFMREHLKDCNCLGNRRLKKSKKLGLGKTAGRAELCVSPPHIRLLRHSVHNPLASIAA